MPRIEEFKVGDRVIAEDFYKKPFEAVVDTVKDTKLTLRKDNGFSWNVSVRPDGHVGANVDKGILRHAEPKEDRLLIEEREMLKRLHSMGVLYNSFGFKVNREPKPSLMSTLKKKLKDLTLSEDEKLLRRHGLVDACGDKTDIYKDLAIEKLCEDKRDEIISELKALEKEEEKKK